MFSHKGVKPKCPIVTGVCLTMCFTSCVQLTTIYTLGSSITHINEFWSAHLTPPKLLVYDKYVRVNSSCIKVVKYMEKSCIKQYRSANSKAKSKFHELT